MPETLRCPSCGAANDPAATACAQCNFPLAEGGAPKASPTPAPAPAEAPPEGGAPGAKPEPVSKFDPGPRPVRRRRSRPGALQPVQIQIWLVAAAGMVLGIVYFAARGFWSTNAPPVEGAQPDQQHRADHARQLLAQDSTNIEARIELANVLYDTGNWSEAIVHYRSADRQDPKRSTVVVDLAVCYYNLGHFAVAESLFHHALSIQPEQVYALFNLGIVAERQEQWDKALDFYHRAMRAGPPEGMRSALEQHLQAVMARTGRQAPPLK